MRINFNYVVKTLGWLGRKSNSAMKWMLFASGTNAKLLCNNRKSIVRKTEKKYVYFQCVDLTCTVFRAFMKWINASLRLVMSVDFLMRSYGADRTKKQRKSCEKENVFRRRISLNDFLDRILKTRNEPIYLLQTKRRSYQTRQNCLQGGQKSKITDNVKKYKISNQEKQNKMHFFTVYTPFWKNAVGQICIASICWTNHIQQLKWAQTPLLWRRKLWLK